ncbi:hypothetical protein [Actinopolymorpha pittospori]|uniref:Uncharacterized protein n=1 Tax=Actinopolymorpha pittospori TaxID=648752 RepID=A0A927R7M7_9ACTN|nr:hypothetical protein [Actinopolymorpha pittospori]MBE1604399.1 hypothetical protein [Actinopolymorpha pittospori]
MDWTRILRMIAASVLGGLVAIGPTVPSPAGGGATTATTPSGEADVAKAYSKHTPQPPRLPRNFRGKGKWIVRDLGITVPFTWEGKDGDSQMVAGGPQYPIWFTNLIYNDTLYTLTYKWPNLTDHRCSQIPGFSLETLNEALEGSRFVGPEILQRGAERTTDRKVNHWRVGVVLPQLPPGKFPRLPFALGDIYVDQKNPGTFWQVLQFGVQNLYDPQLDEWAVMNTFQHKPGTVTLPAQCQPPR